MYELIHDLFNLDAVQWTRLFQNENLFEITVKWINEIRMQTLLGFRVWAEDFAASDPRDQRSRETSRRSRRSLTR